MYRVARIALLMVATMLPWRAVAQGPVGSARAIPARVDITLNFTQSTIGDDGFNVKRTLNASMPAQLFAVLDGTALAPSADENLSKGAPFQPVAIPVKGASVFRFQAPLLDSQGTPTVALPTGHMRIDESQGALTEGSFVGAAAVQLYAQNAAQKFFTVSAASVQGVIDGSRKTSAETTTGRFPFDGIGLSPAEVHEAALHPGVMPKGGFQFEVETFRQALITGKPATVTSSENFNFDDDGTRFSGNVTLTLSIRPPPAVELVMEPVDAAAFAKWVPVPKGATPREVQIFGPSAPVAFKISFHRPNGPVGDSMLSDELRAKLTDVSHHRGICSNYPFNAAPSEEPDLRFAKEQPPGVVFDSISEVHSARNDVAEMVVLIDAFDGAPYGKLTATAKNLMMTAVRPGTSSTEFTIPLDDNHNHIADGWETAENVPSAGLPETWDDDALPEHQRNTGDGYTLFEEYRGFVTYPSRGVQKFERFTATMKDAFFIDDDGVLRKYYAPNAALLSWHYVLQAETRNRVTNVNTDEYRYGDQYAILTHLIPGTHGTDAGGAVGTSDELRDGWQQRSLMHCSEILLYEGSAEQQIGLMEKGVNQGKPFPNRAAALDWYFRSTVIHEVGHCLGIHHHLKRAASKVVITIDRKSGDAITNEDSQGGVQNCAVRYPNTADALQLKQGVLPPVYRYCTLGDRPRNNCMGQLEVKVAP